MRKTFITLMLVGIFVSALAVNIELNEEQEAKAKAYFQECLKLEKVSEHEADKLRKREFAHPSQNMKCFGACFFEKVGALKDNKIQEQMILQKLKPIIGEEKTKELLHNCKNIKGTDRCDTGYKIYQCLQDYKYRLSG